MPAYSSSWLNIEERRWACPSLSQARFIAKAEICTSLLGVWPSRAPTAHLGSSMPQATSQTLPSLRLQAGSSRCAAIGYHGFPSHSCATDRIRKVALDRTAWCSFALVRSSSVYSTMACAGTPFLKIYKANGLPLFLCV